MEESIREEAEYFLTLSNHGGGEYSPLALAYLGDAVYELLIRTMVMDQGNVQPHKLHKKSSSLVNAGTQAAMMRSLLPRLSQEEEAVYKRGRNAKSVTSAKHATIIDYRTATGFEALIGYLYLERRFGRIVDLVKEGLEAYSRQKEEGKP
jgi:ribonuclease-3 family protein